MMHYQDALKLLRYWNVATDPVDREAVLELMVRAARQHPGMLAPLCFTVDRTDTHGHPLPMFPEPFHWEWLDHFMQEQVFLLLAARGHGKSEYASAVYAAWTLGVNPRQRVLHVTASDTLATMYSRRLQEILMSPAFRMVFPDFPGPGRKWSEHEWYLNVPGLRDPTWRCASVESRIVGARADLILADDIISQDNSRTDNGRNTLMAWYRSTLRPMLVPETGKMLIVGTRYHQDDLYGIFLRGGIRHAIYPAEDEQGVILWPHRFTRESLEANKTPPEGSAASYATQYLCQPVNPAGEIFNREWFPIDVSPDDLTEVYWSWDTAVTAKTSADFTAGVLGGIGKDKDAYVLDVLRGQWEPGEAKRQILGAWNRARGVYGGRLRALLVEDSQAGRVIQAWIKESAPQIPVLLVSPAGQDKATRANLIVPYCEARRVHVVEGAGVKPWVDIFLDELAMFTATKRHAHDDMVDALVYLVCRLFGLASSRGRMGSVVAVTGTGM